MIRNKFSLSNYKLLTADMGNLIPIGWFEALPGDTIQQATSCLIRISPLLSPVMHPVRIRIHHWFVPNRLIDDDWEDFITGGSDGTFTRTKPHFSVASVAEGSLHDYLGVPPATYSPNLEFSALPCRAYQLIFNEHYRDEDLVTAAALSKASGADSTTAQTIQKVAWEKDYFTTARSTTQKGSTVTIPLGTTAPVTGIGKGDQTFSLTSQAAYETDGSGTETYAKASGIDGSPAASQHYVEEDPNNTGYPNIRVDLSQASGIDINDLRLSLATQRYQERMQTFGSRYSEYIRYLGIKSSDARLQNPEYVGGGRQIVQFSEVLSTDGANTGDMKGHGIAALRSNRYRRFFEEHGIVMSLLSVIPKAIYTQGLHKGFQRDVKEDYFQREFQHLGEQEVLNNEIYTEHASPADTFGYQARYDEYRSLPSTIAGEFRSTLDHWHYARIFASDPALNSTFVQATPTKRVNASAGTDCMYIMANHSIQARRLMAKFAKPRTF